MVAASGNSTLALKHFEAVEMLSGNSESLLGAVFAKLCLSDSVYTNACHAVRPRSEETASHCWANQLQEKVPIRSRGAHFRRPRWGLHRKMVTHLQALPSAQKPAESHGWGGVELKASKHHKCPFLKYSEEGRI